VASGPAISVQDTAEQQTVLTMATQQHVDVSFTTADLLLSLDDFSERVLLPMMNNLAGAVASNIMSNVAESICNITANVDGSNNIITPTSQQYLRAQALLAINSAPMVGHKIINDPIQEADVVQSLSGLLNPTTAISDQYYEGTMYKALGAMWYSDQTVIKHTAGTFTSGSVNQGGQTGTALTVQNMTGTLVVGDIITIANVNAVNRVTKQTTGRLRQFVVTVAVANGGTTLNIYPALVPSANGVAGGPAVQYQTVDSSPAASAAISLFTNPSAVYNNSFRYAPQAFTMATGDLPLPANKVTARHKYDNVSMRAVKDYVIGTDQEVTRVDVLYGSLAVRPEWAVRVPGPVS
jgi:hypothetical protein